jgi:hypothetical protein
MQTLAQERRLRREFELTKRAWRVLQDSRELIKERRAQAVRREQLLRRKDRIAREEPRSFAMISARARAAREKAGCSRSGLPSLHPRKSSDPMR